MPELLTSAQMRAVEQAEIESGAVTGLELMERAGRGVVQAIFARWPEFVRPPIGGGAGQAPVVAQADAPGALPRTPGYLGTDEGGLRAVVLCGPGNNGGDGFVVARLLHDAGWRVQVFLYGDAARLPPDARVNYDLWCQRGEVRPWTAGWLFQAELLVDALFGIGLNRPIEGFETVFDAIRDAQWNIFSGPRSPGLDAVVSIDVPSGLCSDSGRWLLPPEECGVEPDLTVTFHRRKIGHVLAEDHLGDVVVVDLGLPRQPLAVASVETCGAPLWREVAKNGDHKFSHGHALVLSGPAGAGGATRLAARGALRVGAGLVTVAAPLAAMAEHAARLDAVMLRQVEDGGALRQVLADRRISALCLGPGLGLGARQAGLVAAALQDGRPLVLDADALTLIAGDPALFGALHRGAVLTPHGGEFARLFPELAARLAEPPRHGPAYSKIDAAREAAARAGCVLLFKGPATVIAAPDGRVRIHDGLHDRPAPWLATAGSGDVLAGLITGLLARGAQPFTAACRGAWLHAEAARSFGPGLIAEDLPDELPKVFRALASGQRAQ